MIGVSKTTISRIEGLKAPYSQDILEVAAEKLKCSPADLVSRDPIARRGKSRCWKDFDPFPRRNKTSFLPHLTASLAVRQSEPQPSSSPRRQTTASLAGRGAGRQRHEAPPLVIGNAELHLERLDRGGALGHRQLLRVGHLDDLVVPGLMQRAVPV